MELNKRVANIIREHISSADAADAILALPEIAAGLKTVPIWNSASKLKLFIPSLVAFALRWWSLHR